MCLVINLRSREYLDPKRGQIFGAVVKVPCGMHAFHIRALTAAFGLSVVLISASSECRMA